MAEKILQISTFRPEMCGIASWTEDVINYCHAEDPNLINRVLAVNGFRKKSEYADFVDFCIERHELRDYSKIAETINEDDSIKMVSIQHEFGIFGGNMGDYILPFLDSLRKPKLLTLHTVPRDEETDQKTIDRKKVLKQIIPRVDQIIAISDTSKQILIDEYQADPLKLNVILHGTHPFNESPKHAKKILDLEDSFVLSTVGLVRKKRGLEQVIRALPPVVKEHPKLKYLIAGTTHPREIEKDGREPYREQLIEESKDLGIEDNVRFVNNYLPLNSLLRHIQASDICITPYTFPGQISSGVLSYCIGLDKPVISTPFLYAQEILGQGRGILLPDFNNPKSISESLLSIIENQTEIKKIKKNLQPLKNKMLWPNVARQYIEIEKDLIANY